MGTHQIASVCFLLFLHITISSSAPQPILQMLPRIKGSFDALKYLPGDEKNIEENFLYCDSWRLTVETNNAGEWPLWIFPPWRCLNFTKKYYYSKRYPSDAKAVAEAALRFAKTVNISDDGKDAWVFDVDDTLLSYAEYFLQQWPFVPFDSEEPTVDESNHSAIPSSLTFYKDLKKLGFTIFLLTGRNESRRAETIENLHQVGYWNWERLLMRGPSDQDLTATIFKSNKRRELEAEGYRIHGSSGDQWSDLLGYAVAERSFKLPNPWYYVP